MVLNCNFLLIFFVTDVRKKLCDAFFLLLTAVYILSSLVLMFEVSMMYMLPPLSSFFLLVDGVSKEK